MMIQFNKYKKQKQAEIFCFIVNSLLDCGFVPQTKILVLQRQYYQTIVLAKNIKSINLKLKMSRFNAKQANNLTLLTGFYRSV
jgi:hypothetical protein